MNPAKLSVTLDNPAMREAATTLLTQIQAAYPPGTETAEIVAEAVTQIRNAANDHFSGGMDPADDISVAVSFLATVIVCRSASERIGPPAAQLLARYQLIDQCFRFVTSAVGGAPVSPMGRTWVSPSEHPQPKKDAS